MSELNELSNTKYAYLRSLSLEELLERLAVAPIPTVSPEKQAYVDALKEAIIEKENENPTGFFPDVDQQWEQFVTQYLPEIEETALEPERMEHADFAQTKQQSLEVPPKACCDLPPGLAHDPGCRRRSCLYVCHHGYGPGRRH